MVRKRKSRVVTGSTRTSVDLLLAEDVKPLGQQGDIVRVKPGYARNYLLPQGLATVASDENKRMIDRYKVRVAEVAAEQVKLLKKRAEEISRYSVTLEANANTEGHLYGSVVASDISRALASAGYRVETENIMLEGPLKELGMYTIKIELHPDVKTEVKVWVVPTANT